MQCLIHRRRNRDFVKFQQEIIALVDAIRPGIFAQGAEVLWAEVKIAAGGNLQPVAELREQLLSELADMREITPKFAIGVWSCHSVRDALGDCCFRTGSRSV